MYVCNSDHTSSATFEADMVAGSEKWHSISSNSGGDSTSYKQITKLNATAGTVVTIPINNTLTFIKPPVEILKFVQGSWNHATYGTDVTYGYTNNDVLTVTLVTANSFKINYQE